MSSDQGADDFVEGLGLAGLVVKAGAASDHSTADDSGGPEQQASSPPSGEPSTANTEVIGRAVAEMKPRRRYRVAG